MYITRLKIENVKLLRDFELTFGSAEEPRMWTVLIGENGLCKTTILRAIAMAATGHVRANQLADIPSFPDRRAAANNSFRIQASLSPGQFGHPHRDYPGFEDRPLKPPQIESKLVGSGEQSNIRGTSCYITKAKGLSREELVRKAFSADTTDPVDEAASHELPHWFVAGFGTSRLLPAPLESRPPKVLSRDRLRSLFDQSSIIGTGFASFLEDPSAFTDALREALIKSHLLPAAKDINVRGRNWANSRDDYIEGDLVSMAVGKGTIDVPATWLSQGYQSTISWIADLIGQFYFEREKPVPLNEMEGLVLIDEIDLHLHPGWQVDLISAIRRVFPRLQFVVTTHSPMVLPGLKREEIVMLRQDDEGNVVWEEAAESPALMTGSQIYNEFFGIDRLYPTELGEALHRYSFLVGMSHREDAEEEELMEIRELLQAAGVDPGWDLAGK